MQPIWPVIGLVVDVPVLKSAVDQEPMVDVLCAIQVGADLLGDHRLSTSATITVAIVSAMNSSPYSSQTNGRVRTGCGCSGCPCCSDC